MNKENTTNTSWTLLFFAWLIACVSTLGSLFFSEVMEFAPCSLCWYQRIALFPLVFVLLAGLFPLDKRVVRFSFPLTFAGWCISVYHNLLHAGIIPESMQPCSQGVSCSQEYIKILGFFSIPVLSLLAFTSILTLLILFRITIHKSHRN